MFPLALCLPNELCRVVSKIVQWLIFPKMVFCFTVHTSDSNTLALCCYTPAMMAVLPDSERIYGVANTTPTTRESWPVLR